MTPIERKASSERLIRGIGLPVLDRLPLIESEEETQLRSPREVLQRLVALWAVAGTAMLRGSTYFREYIVENNLLQWLSKREREFLLIAEPNDYLRTQFSWQVEALYFIAWCAGLIESIEVPAQESSTAAIAHLFPQEKELPERLESSIRLRGVPEILDWADMLYRLHWATRNSRLKGEENPGPVNPDVIQEWHRAVNWMTRFESEDDWDYVPTDT